MRRPNALLRTSRCRRTRNRNPRARCIGPTLRPSDLSSTLQRSNSILGHGRHRRRLPDSAHRFVCTCVLSIPTMALAVYRPDTQTDLPLRIRDAASSPPLCSLLTLTNHVSLNSSTTLVRDICVDFAVRRIIKETSTAAANGFCIGAAVDHTSAGWSIRRTRSKRRQRQ